MKVSRSKSEPLNRKQLTSEDVDGKKGESDDVKLDEGHVRSCFGTDERETQNPEIRRMIMREDCVVEIEGLLHGDNVV